jgi:TolB-like protein
MASVWGELKRRNVVKVAIAYAIVSWLVLQLANILVPILTLPEWAERLVFLILLLGFPLALLFSWAFELTPEGIKKEKHVARSESVTDATGRKLNSTIIGVLVVALVFFAVDKFVLSTDSTSPAEVSSEISAATGHNSIAVLPFVNMSSDPEQEYFSDGLSEEILNLLAKVPDLKVIGRTSSFAFKGKNEDLRIIGDKLDVSTVLEGSVRKSGDRVRITAQLIEVSNGAHLWSETYDRTLDDIFAVQDSVAAEILEALQIHVGEAPTRGRPTENSDAYSLFLKAKTEMNAWQASRAEDLLLQAVRYDPAFAEAWEMLAYAYWEQWGSSIDSSTATQRVINAASKALAINPDLVFAQYLLKSASTNGNALFQEVQGLEQLLLEEPSHGPGRVLLIYYLMYGGYFNESLVMTERLIESDPLSPNALFLYNQVLFATGRKGEAFAALELADQVGSAWSKGNLAFFNWEEGRYDVSLTYTKAALQEVNLPTDWVDDMHVGANDPENGLAFLNSHIPEIVASVPVGRAFEMQLLLDGWYLTYGFLDRYFEIIFERSPTKTAFGDSEVLIFNGQLDRNSGFTAHPEYLRVARNASLIDLWEERGPPDFCEKTNGEWVCE